MNTTIREVDNRDLVFMTDYYVDRVVALRSRIKELERQLNQRDEAIGELVRTRGEL